MNFTIYKNDNVVTPLFELVAQFLRYELHTINIIVNPQNVSLLSKGRVQGPGGFIVIISGIYCYDVYDVAAALEKCGYRTTNVAKNPVPCAIS